MQRMGIKSKGKIQNSKFKIKKEQTKSEAVSPSLDGSEIKRKDGMM